MTQFQLDFSRILILSGYVVARLADLQFERALFAAIAGISIIAIMRWLVDPIVQRNAPGQSPPL